MTTIIHMPIEASTKSIRGKIEKISKNNVLSHNSVTLLAASKGQSVEAIRTAIGAGITDFGENRVQEAESKWPLLKAEFPHVRLHLIGPLQSNKAAQALELFDVVQTLDREKLALAFASAHAATKDFFIQINTGEEPQKAGVAPKEAPQFIRYCRDLGLNIVGLMCIPPLDQPPAPHFALLRKIALDNGLRELSMGMSDDFETAVRMGSSCVRIGKALFGPR